MLSNSHLPLLRPPHIRSRRLRHNIPTGLPHDRTFPQARRKAHRRRASPHESDGCQLRQLGLGTSQRSHARSQDLAVLLPPLRHLNSQWWYLNIRSFDHQSFRFRQVHHHPLQHPLWRCANGLYDRWRLPGYTLQGQKRCSNGHHHSLNHRYRNANDHTLPRQQPRQAVGRLLPDLLLPRYQSSHLLVVAAEHRR